MKITLLLLMFLISNCLHAFSFPLPTDHHAFLGWQTVKDYATGTFNSSELEKNNIKHNCNHPDKKLYPTHPQQYTKVYHLFEYGNYNSGKLTANSQACALASKYKKSSDSFSCIKADYILRTVISDLYQDRCGDYFRAYWFVMYFNEHESMGTLSSKGRTSYPKPYSPFTNEYFDGNTYPLNIEDFIFIQPISKKDIESIKSLSRDAINSTHFFDSNSHLFKNK